MNVSSRLNEYSEVVDAALRRVVADRNLPLYSMMEHHLGWDIENPGFARTPTRTLGALCLASCDATRGDHSTGAPLAAAIELVFNFCEIHDDIQSGTVERGDRDSVWWKWGPAQAINAGDGMHALARLALFDLKDQGFGPAKVFEAVQLLDQASLATCEGRFVDLQAQERLDVTSDAYLNMASAKTGSLYGCAMEFGALAAGQGGEVRSAFASAGTNLGVAAQIADDVRQLTDGLTDSAAPSNDFMNKKKLFPVVRAFETATPSERRALGDFYFKRVLEPSDVRSLAKLVSDLGAIDQAQEIVDAHLDAALGDVAAVVSDDQAPHLQGMMTHAVRGG